MRIEIFPDAQGQWRFRLIARNGQIVAQSEGYTRKSSAHYGALSCVFGIIATVTGQDWTDLDIRARIVIVDVDE